MSFRGIGEGHLSSVGFRTGSIFGDGRIVLDERGPFPMIGALREGIFNRDVFHERLKAMDQNGESSAYVLDHLPLVFSIEELEARLEVLISQHDTRQDAHTTARHHRAIASSSYGVQFGPESDISERVLWPVVGAESNGMEDARFVRFVDEHGAATYFATYTAFDGENISQQLHANRRLRELHHVALVGAASKNKGLALFPGRSMDGSRHCRASTARPTPCASPTPSAIGGIRSPINFPTVTGRCSNSATVARRLRRRPAGWC